MAATKGFREARNFLRDGKKDIGLSKLKQFGRRLERHLNKQKLREQGEEFENIPSPYPTARDVL